VGLDHNIGTLCITASIYNDGGWEYYFITLQAQRNKNIGKMYTNNILNLLTNILYG